MGQHWTIFVNFHSFQQIYWKIVDFGGIQTWIVRVEGEYLTTAVAPYCLFTKGKSIVCKGVLSHILIGHLKLVLNWAWKNIQLTTNWPRHTGRSGPVRQSLTTCNHSNSSSSAAARPHPRNSYKLAWLGSELIQRRGISPGNHWQLFGRGDGLTVSVLAFSSDDLSSNPAEVYSFSFVKLFVNEQKEAGYGHFWIWWLPR